MPRGRKYTVVDSNVPIVANRRDGGSRQCASACAKALQALKEQGTVVLDDQELILGEYRKYLRYKGELGVGDQFYKWLIDNHGKPDLCKKVSVSQIEHQWRMYEEFPNDQTLADFDKSDQKFVAVAASSKGTSILQASDHKWLNWHEKLRAHGVKVQFLCEEELRATQSRKSPR